MLISAVRSPTGYDIGVTGGVHSMASFQEKFFPEIYERTQLGVSDTSPYCKYDNQVLQTFTSTMFLAGMFSSLVAATVCRKYGRKPTMFLAACLFIIGAGLQGGAVNLAMLFLGRCILGFGVGFANTAVPMYLSEVAPAQYRGGLNILFQFAVTFGILVAGLVNYGTQNFAAGWRVSLGLAGAFAIVLGVGSLVLPESPNSLVERGKVARGRAVLQRLRGVEDVEAELEDMIEATEEASRVTLRQSYSFMFHRANAPQLIIDIIIQFFQQFTGINAIMFYVPVLFNSLGTSRKTSLLNTIIINCINCASTMVAVLLVDRFGRRFFLLEAGVQMFVSQLIVGIVLATQFGKYEDGQLPTGTTVGVLVVICVFISSFAWSWGPMGWLVPSEIHTLETRPAGMAIAVAANFLFTFVIGQSFLSMLCAMKWGVFIFFAGWVVIMTLFAYFLIPETKGVPVERVPILFARHALWSRVMGPVSLEIIERDATRTVSRQAAADQRAAANGALKKEPL
ncbi:H(+)/hexose cotransporter 2 [Auxenochlorella protothecoides]|uniref:H(+)/hexose cotransporter 2 n=1 Tax=Auxenochlorella protothecoides TaxID=3075 RepID=A0A087SMA1_AUXPR|nr:H(+)/hexose cotransporter 2 [Auxenochlorella protothecoides]KFM26855.1 H(+)/hexose cotransporter 2 [Auxenochlorella protothecoides]